jgi:hypothetical protein
VEKRKSQNSILFVATLGVIVLFGLFAETNGQQVKNQVDDTGCYQLRNKVRELEVKYLWFNHKSIDEYSNLVKSMLTSFPDNEVGFIDASWKSSDDSRPFRSLEFVSNDPDSRPSFSPVSLKMRKNVEEDILTTGNGLPGKQFAFRFSRDASYSNFRLEIKLPELDRALVEHVYSMALADWPCEGYSSWGDKLLKSTNIEVKEDKMIFTSKIKTDSIEKYLTN